MRSLLSRSLEYLVLLLIVAGAAFAVVQQFGDDDADPPASAQREAPPPASVPTCRAAGITPTSTKQGTCRTETSTLTIVDESGTLALPSLRVRVRDAEATAAATPQGRARDRLRIAVRLEVENAGTAPFVPSGPDRGIYVVAGTERIDSDVAARAQPGAFVLGDPIPAGGSRAGTLRFELMGAAGRSVERHGRAQLGVRVAADRVGVVRLRFPELGGG